MISVLVPWRSGCEYRERAWEWVQGRYERVHPDWELVPGGCDGGPFNRAAAILDAAQRASGDIFVVADADVWVDPQLAVDNLDTWAIPHLKIHRLSKASTWAVYGGWIDWRSLPLSNDNRQDSKPYKGHETGTMFVIRRDILFDVPPDIRFVGWGSEDDAWACALNTLVGRPWRGDADLVHLYHPPQPRKSRIVGNDTSMALLRRYKQAKHSPTRMRALLDEVRSGVSA